MSKKYLDMAFIYLYICPLFLKTLFSYPKPFGEKAQPLLKLILDRYTYNTCIFRKGISPFCDPKINFSHLRGTLRTNFKTYTYA